MKQFSLIIFLMLFGLPILTGQSPETTPKKKFFKLFSKGGVEADTTKKSGSDSVDGVRTEMDSKRTGAKKADESYRNLGFKTSISQYLKDKHSKSKSLDKETMLRIANGFRLNSQTEEAEYWYSNVITEESKPKHILRYAQVLQSNGKCEDATRWYQHFREVAPRKMRNRSLIVNCEDLKSIKTHKNVTIENVAALNTDHLDFSPIPYKDGVIFSSTRGNAKVKGMIDSWTNDNYSDLFYAEFGDNLKNFNQPVELKGDLNKQFHDGVATFDQSGMVMFFTRNNDNGKSYSEKGLVDLKVYSAVWNDGYWGNITELPFNSNEFTSCHPTLSPDGKRLYFASNRKGGYGGLDIYVSENQGGVWQEPRNLGPTVNSAGNELFPVIHKDETLYYASNGHQGLGGLDIFYAKRTNPEDQYSWGVRENLGAPFNSTKDDFGFVIIGQDGNTGYLTSNRKGGYGKDDIYTWTKDGVLNEDAPMRKTICVYDSKTGKRINNALVTVKEGIEEEENEDGNLMLTLEPLNEKEDKFILGITGKQKKSKKSSITKFETDNEGTFTMTALPDKFYTIEVEKEGFENEKMTFDYFEIKKENELCLPIKKRNCKVMATTVVNKKYDSAMPQAVVEVWNKCTNQKEKYTTDETGTFEICIPCGCEFRLFGSKSGFDSDTEFLSTLEGNCETTEKLEVKLELGVRELTVVNTPTPISTPQVPTVPVTTYEEVITYVPKTELVPITTHIPISDLVNAGSGSISEGQVISLKEIFYDFDKFNIRTDASVDLNHVLTLLQKYPSLEIELMSHTDSRGTHQYNVWLSNERAKSARAYLISKGIQAHRVTAAGYGENQLRNKCADGVLCTEEEHQQNRRTEVKVTKFNEPNVRVRE